MTLGYGLFGLFAMIALVVNLAFIIAALSLLQATLTLAGNCRHRPHHGHVGRCQRADQ